MPKRSAPTPALRSSKRRKIMTTSETLKEEPRVRGDVMKEDGLKQIEPIERKREDGVVSSRKIKKKEEPRDGGNNDSEQFDGVSAYEKMRLKNIQDNKMFLSEIGFFQAKEEFQLSTAKKKKPISAMLKIKKKKTEPAPRRISLRLANKDPTGIELPQQSSQPAPTYEYDHSRKPTGPMKMDDALKYAEEEDGGDFLRNLKAVAQTESWDKEKSTPESYDSYVKSLNKMTLNENRVAKVVVDRIFSVAVHPSQTKVLAVAGDKWGKIGFWDVEATSDDSSGVQVYEPHSRPVNCLKFGIAEPEKLYSCSYDGTVRCCDIEKGVFNELYRSSEEYEERCIAFDFVSPHTLTVGLGDGTLVLQDSRTYGESTSYDIQNRAIKCVSVHPMKSHCLCTSANDGIVSIWDTRNMKQRKSKPLDTVSCGRTVSSAYFSPVTGCSILTTSLDDRLRVFSSNDLDDVEIRSSVRHDNHVGRWLTGFRAEWHPSREDIFVVGSMNKPRQIEIYNQKCEVVKIFRNPEILTSVCSVNSLHPSRNILVGGNASGRVFVFM